MKDKCEIGIGCMVLTFIAISVSAGFGVLIAYLIN